MIREIEKAYRIENGVRVYKDIVTLVPENEEDVKELDRLREAGLLDSRHSFGDPPVGQDSSE